MNEELKSMHKGRDLFLQLISQNQDIEPHIWCGIFIDLIVEFCLVNDLSFDHFKELMTHSMEKYKNRWERS